MCSPLTGSRDSGGLVTVVPWPGAGRSERPLWPWGRTMSPQDISRAPLSSNGTAQGPGCWSLGTRSQSVPLDTCRGRWQRLMGVQSWPPSQGLVTSASQLVTAQQQGTWSRDPGCPHSTAPPTTCAFSRQVSGPRPAGLPRGRSQHPVAPVLILRACPYSPARHADSVSVS